MKNDRFGAGIRRCTWRRTPRRVSAGIVARRSPANHAAGPLHRPPARRAPDEAPEPVSRTGGVPLKIERTRQTVRLSVETDPRLVDALSDFLTGALDAAVEHPAAESGPVTLHGFVCREPAGQTEIDELAGQVRGFAAAAAAALGCPPPAVSAEIVAEHDWAERWKEFFAPFEIVPGLVIAPTWSAYEADTGTPVIVMDPGLAFGTGQHPTTRLCVELLRESPAVAEGANLLDVGTGTGILGMAALLFGAATVTAVDTDPDAVRAARSNCARNKMAERMTVTGTPLAGLAGPFRVVVANIVQDVLLDLAGELARLTADGGILILAGLLAGEQADRTAGHYRQFGFEPAAQRADEPWCVLKLIKRGTAAGRPG